MTKNEETKTAAEKYEEFVKNPPSAEALLDDPSLDPRFGNEKPAVIKLAGMHRESIRETNPATGHTPGPWEVEKALKGTNWELYPAHNRYPCQQPIAQGWASDIGERHQAEAEAHANLIAAAPDMLAA